MDSGRPEELIMETPDYVKRSDAGAKRMFIFALAILGIVVIAAVATMLGGGSNPEELVATWLEHVRSERYAEAYELLGSETRSWLDMEDFRSSVSASTSLSTPGGLVGGKLNEDEMSLTGRLETEAGVRMLVARFDMEAGMFTKSHTIEDVTIDGVSAIRPPGAP